MSTDKQEIDRIINEIICNGNYWDKKFGADGSNIGGFIWANDAGRLTPPSWPKFDANWMMNEFYIGALKTEHLHEWLEHLFELKRYAQLDHEEEFYFMEEGGDHVFKNEDILAQFIASTEQSLFMKCKQVESVVFKVKVIEERPMLVKWDLLMGEIKIESVSWEYLG